MGPTCHPLHLLPQAHLTLTSLPPLARTLLCYALKAAAAQLVRPPTPPLHPYAPVPRRLLARRRTHTYLPAILPVLGIASFPIAAACFTYSAAVPPVLIIASLPFATCFAYCAAASPMPIITSLAFATACFAYSAVVSATPAVASLALAAACLVQSAAVLLASWVFAAATCASRAPTSLASTPLAMTVPLACTPLRCAALSRAAAPAHPYAAPLAGPRVTEGDDCKGNKVCSFGPLDLEGSSQPASDGNIPNRVEL
jgi:hypothetical protein